VTIIGIGLLGIFVLTMVIITSLVVPGTVLDGMWASKPDARALFDNLGGFGILLLAVLGVLGIVTGIGMLQRRRWARWVTVALLGANVVPDLIQGFTVDALTLIAAVPVGAVVVYLALPIVGRALRPRVDRREN
jgi:uncharacterized membrane protein (DUF2068 family)